MRRLSIFLILFSVFFASCSKENLVPSYDGLAGSRQLWGTKSIPADAILDETSGFYLVPNEDVYELSKVQAVYEDLTQNSNKLLPTHRAIKMFPSDESTAYRILTDTTIWASRVPFGFRPVAQKRETEPRRFNNSDAENHIAECSICDVDSGRGTSPEITPIYVRWPIDRRLPENVDSEVLYDIYTPLSTSPTDSLLSRALAPNIQTRGVRPDAGFHPAWMDPWSLKIRFWDNRLNAYKNAANIHVHYMDYYSYYSQTLITNSDAKVFVPEDVPMLAVVYLEFYSDKFKITDDNSALFHVEFVDIVDNLCDYPYSLELGSPVTTLDYPYSFKRQVFQAARYYYKGNNDLLNNIDKLHLENPLRIATYQDSTSLHHDGIEGIGWYFGGSNPRYIEIANYSASSSFIFGTVLHELGHASHHTELGSSYGGVIPRIKESFASFMGWYNVKKYYSSVLTTDSLVHSACSQGRQNWSGGDSPYAPIYIDFIDDYNQFCVNPTYVDDIINGVSVTDVLSFAIGPTTWAQSVALMQQQVGVLYSSNDLNNLLMLY